MYCRIIGIHFRMNNATRWELMSPLIGCVAMERQKRRLLLAEIAKEWFTEDAESAQLFRSKLNSLFESLECLDTAVENSFILAKLDPSTLDLSSLTQLRHHLNSAILLLDKRSQIIDRIRKTIVQLQKDITVLKGRPALLAQLKELIR